MGLGGSVVADTSILSETFFRVENLTFGYKDAPLLFNSAEFVCGINERVGIVADNGTGKTTFLRILTGLTTPTTMRLNCLGREIATSQDFAWVRTRAGFVLQNSDDQLFFPEVIDDVMFGPMNLGKTENQAKEIAQEVLVELGIESLAARDSFSLSGDKNVWCHWPASWPCGLRDSCWMSPMQDWMRRQDNGSMPYSRRFRDRRF